MLSNIQCHRELSKKLCSLVIIDVEFVFTSIFVNVKEMAVILFVNLITFSDGTIKFNQYISNIYKNFYC